MTYSSKTTCPDRVLPSTSGFFSARDEAKSSHSTLHTSHCTLRTPNFKLHTPHFTLHTPHFTLHSPHFTLLTSHCFLHTPNLTLHSLRPTLHTALNLRGTKNTNATKWRKSADKSLSQPSCSHTNTIYEILQKTIVLQDYKCSHSTKQPWRSHYKAICRDWVAKSQ